MYEYHDRHAGGLSGHLFDPGTIYKTWTNVSLWSFGVSAPFFSLCIYGILPWLLHLLNSLADFLHVSMIISNMAIELLIDLILSFNNDISAFLIIYLALGVLRLVLSFTLVGIMPLFKHLRENCL